ncbi:Ig-like domain-containing protein [Paenibacillus puerhi]|uniref:Ig-like domain-containing protein n=1 Tax=Paenibacillus puerhi TaxID=2692622 RepID=UPI0013576430|nr:Ig-like domain-containing protein [Paenibacillus puerhi]
MMEGLWKEPKRWMNLTGWSLIVIGTLFVPIMPWYILGDVSESEIGLWGVTAIGGGLATLGGRGLYARSSDAVQRGLLLLCILGMLFVMLAQLPALFSWFIYGGAFVKHWMPWEPAGFGIGVALHVGLIALSAMTIFTAVYALTGRRRRELRMPARQLAVYVTVLLVAAGGLWSWDRYAGSHWIAHTYPADGAVDVPLDAQVEVVWQGVRDSMGMKVRYADQSNQAVPGITGGSMSGMTFRPEGGFAPGCQVQITVDAGRRAHTFTFTTRAKPQP